MNAKLARVAVGTVAVLIAALHAAPTGAAGGRESMDRPSERGPALPGFVPNQPPEGFTLPPVPEASPAIRDGSRRLSIQRIVVEGNTVLPEEDIAAQLRPMAGRAVSVAEVEDLRQLKVQNQLNVLSGGFISTTAAGKGEAGTLDIQADRVVLDSRGRVDEDGKAQFTGLSSRSSGLPTDEGGAILVNAAKSLTLSGGAIRVTTEGSADGGLIHVKTGRLAMTKGAAIDASTFGAGNAGGVRVEGQTVLLHGSTISAMSGPEFSGRTGNIKIIAEKALQLTHGSKISIQNEGDYTATQGLGAGRILVKAPDIILADHSQITTQSNPKNAPAGSIKLQFSDRLRMSGNSIVSTEAEDGNGGTISLSGGRLIQLLDSKLTTSVLGDEDGNGGNITVRADNLIMETGAILANTSGGAKGGDEEVHWRPDVFGFNVIQAAAPNGVNGGINTTAPQLNLSGALANLGGPQFDANAISQEYCTIGTGSTLTRAGQGGLPPKGDELVVY